MIRKRRSPRAPLPLTDSRSKDIILLAGRLIDESGLKGERVGDAEVSSVHANFIVNRGNATGADVLELVRRVRARVRQVKGVELEPEVLLYGRKWQDVL